MSEALLSIRELQVAYGHIEAVRNVDIDVSAGEFVSIIGANGAGKSSVLKAIAGVEKRASGTIRFDGSDIGTLRSCQILQRGIALVPEGRWIFKDQSVEDNLLLGAYRRLKARDPGVQADTEWTLELFPRLRERFRQRAGLLSGGEQQMLAIARALLSRPRLLLVDELSLGLAPVILDQLFEVISGINRRGVAILLVEQIASRALAVTSRTYVFDQGRVSLSGSSSELAVDPRIADVYFGTQPAQQLKVTTP